MTPEARQAERIVALPSPLEIEDHELRFSRAALDAHRRLYPVRRAEALEAGGGVALFFGDLPLTRVLGFGMRGAVEDDDFARLEAFYAEREAGVTIDLCPHADPSALAGLARRGYRAAGWKQLLVRRVGSEDRAAPEPGLGVAVTRVGAGEIGAWIGAVARGFLESDEVDERSHELYTTLFHTPVNTSWLATVDGEPAGGACLSMREGFAALASAGVRREFRRRGVQSALIRARLAFAAQSKCTWARVGAHPGSDSQRNLERHGFQVTYTRMKFTRGDDSARRH